MTWSILARDASGSLGIAIASRFFAVGALCPYLRSGVGAVSTQALVNPMFGPRILDALAAGLAPQAAIDDCLAGDEGRTHRQVHVLAFDGTVAAHTGGQCIDWCGSLRGENFSVAGNMLAGPQVLQATADAFESHAHRRVRRGHPCSRFPSFFPATWQRNHAVAFRSWS